MRIIGKSDIGTMRKTNEDCYAIREIGTNAVLAVVCDGMGGQNSGEIASRMAIDTFCETVLSLSDSHLSDNKLSLSLRDTEVLFANAVSRANDRVYEYQLSHSESAGMGTTLVAMLVIDGESVAWCNIGDSRLYTVDKKDILQVSKDHSYIQYMIDKGEMKSEEAKNSPVRNLITRAIGIEKNAEPDIDLFELSEEERKTTRLLLCSDGLSGTVPEAEIMATVNDFSLSPEQKVDRLIHAALEGGSTDNVTVILADPTR